LGPLVTFTKQRACESMIHKSARPNTNVHMDDDMPIAVPGADGHVDVAGFRTRVSASSLFRSILGPLVMCTKESSRRSLIHSSAPPSMDDDTRVTAVCGSRLRWSC
jgi:hypothetical protein